MKDSSDTRPAEQYAGEDSRHMSTNSEDSTNTRSRRGMSRNRRCRRDGYRRAERTGSSFYDAIDDILPFRLTFVSAAIMIGIVFAVFAAACFSAITLSSASEKLDTAEANVRSCADYYDAESTAVDILAILASDDGNSLADKNGELKYRPDGDKNTVITISRNGGSFSFNVPVSKNSTQKNLHVIAQITEGNINVIEWYLRDAD